MGTLFASGDLFITFTLRDRHQDREASSLNPDKGECKKTRSGRKAKNASVSQPSKCPPDPRIGNWEPDSRYRPAPGPPVRDAALREFEHFLLEMGWECAGRNRQEQFDRLAEGMDRNERRNFARQVCKKCIICEILKDPTLYSFYLEIHRLATRTIGWVIAEEFGRAGGRWHVHLLVRGAQKIRRKKWWRRAFIRFGRSRIEALHE